MCTDGSRSSFFSPQLLPSLLISSTMCIWGDMVLNWRPKKPGFCHQASGTSESVPLGHWVFPGTKGKRTRLPDSSLTWEKSSFSAAPLPGLHQWGPMLKPTE